MSERVIHLFGFIGGDVEDTEASIHETGTLAEVTRGVLRMAESHGYRPEITGQTRTIDGQLRKVEVEVPNKPPHEDMPMWHVFKYEDGPWATLAAPSPDREPGPTPSEES